MYIFNSFIKIMKKTIKHIEPWLWILPFIVFSFVFSIMPIFKTLIFSFFDLNSKGHIVKYEGLNNYFYLFKDKVFYKSIYNTYKFVLLSVPAILLLGFILAFISEKTKHSKRYELVFSIPCAISPPVAALIFQTVFMPRVGLISKIFNIDFNILYSKDLSIFALAFIQIWLSTSYAYVYYRSAFRNIENSIVDNAKLDGANLLQLALHVYLPITLKTTIYLLFANTTTSMLMMSLSNVLTNGGPQYSTMTIIQYIYYKFINTGSLTISNTATVIYLLVFMPLIILFYFVLNRESRK